MTQDRCYVLYNTPNKGKVWVRYTPPFLTTGVVALADKIVRFDHRKNIYYYYKNRSGNLGFLSDQEVITMLLSAIERNEYV